MTRNYFGYQLKPNNGAGFPMFGYLGTNSGTNTSIQYPMLYVSGTRVLTQKIPFKSSGNFSDHGTHLSHNGRGYNGSKQDLVTTRIYSNSETMRNQFEFTDLLTRYESRSESNASKQEHQTQNQPQ